MSETSVSYGSAVKWGVTGAVVTLILNLILFFIGTSADAFGDGIAIIQLTGTPMDAITIASATIFLPIGGSLFFAFFYGRNTKTAKRNYSILALIVYFAFIGGPIILLDNATTLSVILLEIMHVLTAGIGSYLLFTRAT